MSSIADLRAYLNLIWLQNLKLRFLEMKKFSRGMYQTKPRLNKLKYIVSKEPNFSTV
jgi:hypothetical protein